MVSSLKKVANCQQAGGMWAFLPLAAVSPGSCLPLADGKGCGTLTSASRVWAGGGRLHLVHFPFGFGLAVLMRMRSVAWCTLGQCSTAELQFQPPALLHRVTSSGFDSVSVDYGPGHPQSCAVKPDADSDL